MDTVSSSKSFELLLNCQAVDDANDFLGNIFSVEVSSTLSVYQLKEAVKAENAPCLNHLAANKLTLWKLTDPLPPGSTRAEETEICRKIKAIEFPDPISDRAFEGDGTVQVLDSLTELSEYWENLPKPGHLHLIVQVPDSPVYDYTHASRGIKRKRDEAEQARALLAAFAEHAPSSLADPIRFEKAAAGLVQCNRPFEYDTVPIDLLQQEFADFKDDCTQKPSADAVQVLNDLTYAACEWYNHEDDRRDAINMVIFNTLDTVLAPMPVRGTTRMTDGISLPVIIPALIRECRNNEGCALFEAIAYYSNFLHEQLHLEQYTRFPSILMTDVGPQIGFYGCIWSGKRILVEPLTPVYDLTVHWTNDKARLQIAAALDAVLKAITRLNQHYQSIKLTQNPIQREYPFQTSFVDSAGLRTHFTYTDRINNTLAFNAVSEAGDNLVVKFTRQYSEEAHRFLADLGHAPSLRAMIDIPGKWKMIVMEHSQYTQLHSPTLRLDDASRLAIKQRVKEIVEKLHAQEFVHGDIRQVNVLVDKSTLGSPEGVSVHLINFDWAGQVGAAKYPLRINTKTIRRPRDVAGGKLITKSHDLGMINLLFYTV